MFPPLLASVGNHLDMSSCREGNSFLLFTLEKLA